ncbi:S-layer homology domain-containing protein [Lachnospiraceae bacterium NSJ-143]|nr:S-layer homology domain-containing protein [Lachnospiraceae bacterium NSJ-143]
MKRKRGKSPQILSMALAAALIFGQLNVLGASNDINGHWAEKTINKWQDNGLINGYEDGSFQPNKPVSRAEFICMMNKALKMEKTGEISFRDVSAGDWFYNDVAVAIGEQYTAGFTDGTFKPNESITRAQAAMMLSKVISANTENTTVFADAKDIPTWAKPAIEAVTSAGYMSGYTDGTFQPNRVLTRAEAVSTIDRVMTGTETSVVEEQPAEKVSDVVIDSAEKIADKTIDGNLTVSSKLVSGKVTLENVEIKGNLVIEGGSASGIVLNNVTVGGKVIVDKNGIGVSLAGDTEIKEIEVRQPCRLSENDFTGNVKTITISKANTTQTTIDVKADVLDIMEKANISITQNIGKVIIDRTAENTKTAVAENVTVDTMTANGRLDLSGRGTVNLLQANVSGITISPDTTVKKIETATGVSTPSKISADSGDSGSGGSGGGHSSDTAVQDNADIEAAKKVVEGAVYTATQAEAANKETAKAKAQALVNDLNLAGTTATVADGEFIAA